MPQELELPPDLAPLLRRHAVELTDRHWKQDVEGLAQALERIPGFGTRGVPPVVRARAVTLRPVLAAIAVLVVLLAAGAWLVWRPGTAGPAAATAVESTPKAAPIDLSPGVRIRDTGTEGAVAGLVTAMAMEASLAHQKRPVTLSARYLYEKAKTIDRFGSGTEGTDMSATLYVAETFGAPPEDRWPYVAGSRALPKGVTWASMDDAGGEVPRAHVSPRRLRRHRRPARAGPARPRHDRRHQRLVHRRGRRRPGSSNPQRRTRTSAAR